MCPRSLSYTSVRQLTPVSKLLDIWFGGKIIPVFTPTNLFVGGRRTIRRIKNINYHIVMESFLSIFCNVNALFSIGFMLKNVFQN